MHILVFKYEGIIGNENAPSYNDENWKELNIFTLSMHLSHALMGDGRETLGIPIAYQTTLDTSLMKGLDTNIWVMNSPWYLHIWHIHARSVFLNIAEKVRLKQPCMILTPPCGLFTLCFSMLLYGSIANNFAALISLSFDIQASRVSTPNIWINSESI